MGLVGLDRAFSGLIGFNKGLIGFLDGKMKSKRKGKGKGKGNQKRRREMKNSRKKGMGKEILGLSIVNSQCI